MCVIIRVLQYIITHTYTRTMFCDPQPTTAMLFFQVHFDGIIIVMLAQFALLLKHFCQVWGRIVIFVKYGPRK